MNYILLKELMKQSETECGFDSNKFAELIVRECQDRVEHYIRDCGEIGSLPDTVIMKHFGVEE